MKTSCVQSIKSEGLLKINEHGNSWLEFAAAFKSMLYKFALALKMMLQKDKEGGPERNFSLQGMAQATILSTTFPLHPLYSFTIN